MLKAMGSRVAGILAFAALAAIPLPAAAQTPDGQTPAQETSCNGQTGAAYGLCTSYCEAMDCDSAAPAASATACNKVYSNFLRLTGQAPPCLCPCAAGWAQVQQAAAEREPGSHLLRGRRERVTSALWIPCGSPQSRELQGRRIVLHRLERLGHIPVVSVSPLTAPQI